LLQLQDKGRVSLADRLSRWFPALPQAERITLRVLANSTSGYADYVRDEAFIEAFYGDVFRRWTPRELIDISTSKPLVCEPGAYFNYSHANFVILGRGVAQRHAQAGGEAHA